MSAIEASSVAAPGTPDRAGATRLRLVLVIAGLDGGGAERVLTTLANAVSNRGHEVVLVTLGPVTTPFYPLHDAVQRINLQAELGARGVLHRLRLEARLLRTLRTTVRELSPDAVLAFSTETSGRVLLATRGLRTRVVVSERCDPALVPIGRIWFELRRFLFRHADLVVLQTLEAERWIRARTGARRTLVIPNPVIPPVVREDDVRPLAAPVVVALGRMRHEKGFDRLLDAFALTRAAHPAWRLALIGDGPERPALERQADQLGIRDAVTFVGTLERPLATLRQGALFVLPSRMEGFPNALVEAMSIGLPVVSFDCRSGPSTIIEPEVNGLLVPDGRIDLLAQGMSRLMGDRTTARRLGDAARDVVSRFALDRVVTEWIAALRPTAAPAGANDG